MEYPPPDMLNEPNVAAGPKSSKFVSWVPVEGKIRSVPVPLTGRASQFAAVIQFASVPNPVHELACSTSRTSSLSSSSRRPALRPWRRAVLNSLPNRPRRNPLNFMTTAPKEAHLDRAIGAITQPGHPTLPGFSHFFYDRPIPVPDCRQKVLWIGGNAQYRRVIYFDRFAELSRRNATC